MAGDLHASEVVSLNKEERLKFATWCEQEAMAENGLAEQMEKMGIPSSMAKLYRAKASAKMLMAKELKSIEEF